MLRETDKKIETKFGALWLTATDGAHICAHNGRNFSHATQTWEEAPLSVRGVAIGANIHLYRWSDGSWNIGEEGKNTYEHRQSSHLSRTDNWKKEVSESARKAINAETERAVREFVAANPAMLNDAETEHLADEVSKAATAMQEAARAYDEARSAHATAYEALKSHREAGEKERREKFCECGRLRTACVGGFAKNRSTLHADRSAA